MSKSVVLYDGSSYEGQTLDDYSLSLELPSLITTGKKYIFAASGSDIDGLEFLNDGYYGFVGKSAGFPPTVSINSPNDGSLSISLPEINGIVESLESNISKISYVVNVYDEGDNSKLVGTITGDATALDGLIDSQKEEYSIDFNKGQQKFENGYTFCLPVENCRYKYDRFSWCWWCSY